MFKKLVLLLFVVASVAALELDHEQEFVRFIKNYRKRYMSPEDFHQRKAVFVENLRKIRQHNAENRSWKMGINKFADLTAQEFRDQFTGGYVRTGSYQESSSRSRAKDITHIPFQMDWREKGIISEAKDQKHCGSCWALASVEQLESYLALATGNLSEPLSIQQLVSCVPNTMHCGGTGGCSGAIPQLAYLYAQLFGVTTDAAYPYTSGQSNQAGTCEFDVKKMKSAVYIHGYETLPHNDMEAVLQHLGTVGPLASSVDATDFHLYESGVFDSCSYSKNINMNHAVQLVGYGTDPKFGPYWLVRNSWGPDWGEQGYIRLHRDITTQCGLDVTPDKGTQCTGDGNDIQKVCGMCGILFDNSYPLGVDVVSGILPDVLTG